LGSVPQDQRQDDNDYWDKCRACGKKIKYQSRYYMCSVSSCLRKQNPLVYCSVDCWELHVPVMNHKQAGADEYWSPQRVAPQAATLSADTGPRRRLVKTPEQELSTATVNDEDILIVVSKFKQYVKDTSDMQTSANIFPALSDLVRSLADKAMASARQEGRKTIMDRDLPKKIFP
jgi:hypothetical protein